MRFINFPSLLLLSLCVAISIFFAFFRVFRKALNLSKEIIYFLIQKCRKIKISKKELKSPKPRAVGFKDFIEEEKIEITDSSNFDKKTVTSSENIPQQQKMNQPKEGYLETFFEAYDIVPNLKEFLSGRGGPQELEPLRIFDLLKVLACLIIIYYHSSNLRGPLSEMPDENTFEFALIYNMGQIVDLFFWISGFLNYLSLQKRFSQISQNNFCSVFFELVWSRLLRIYPPYILSLFYLWVVHPQVLTIKNDDLGANFTSFVYMNLAQSESCWKNIFMVANHKCMQFSWYMADDLFMYALFVAILYIALRFSHYRKEHKKNCASQKLIIFMFLIGFLLLVQLLSYFILIANGFSYSDYFPSIYPMNTFFPVMKSQWFFFFFTISPVTRFSAFLLGAILALLYEVYSSKKWRDTIIKKLKSVRFSSKLLLYFVIFAITISCYFFGFCIWENVLSETQPIQYQANLWTRAEHYRYLLWWRLFLLIGLTFMILPCLLGIVFDPIRLILKFHWPFLILAKLTYSAYLFHVYVVETFIYISGKQNKTDPITFFFEPFLSDAFIAFSVALFIHLFVEIPIANLLKPVSKNKSKNSSSNFTVPVKNETNKKDEDHKIIIKQENNEDNKAKEADLEIKKAENNLEIKKAEKTESEKAHIVQRNGYHNKNPKESYYFLIGFLIFSLYLHCEIYKELFPSYDSEIPRNNGFSQLQNGSNCSNSSFNIANPKIYFDEVYGVCVKKCRPDDRYLMPLTNSCLAECPLPYMPSNSQKLCCSPLCLTCNASDIDQCFSCRRFRFQGNCVYKCPNYTVAFDSECLFCKETEKTPYLLVSQSECRENCDADTGLVVLTPENYCIENCPDNMRKSIIDNHCCDEHCADCSKANPKECTVCDEKFPFFDESTKTCVKECSQYTNYQTKTCFGCHNTSLFYDLSSKTCVEKCGEGFFTHEQICTKNCSSVDPTLWGTKKGICCKKGCEECLDSKICLNCSKDYLFFSNTSQCVFNCPVGFAYNNKNKTCSVCPNNTEICDEEGRAKWCKPNFYLDIETCRSYCSKGTPDPTGRFCCHNLNFSELCLQNNNSNCLRLRQEKIFSKSMQKYMPLFILLPKNWDSDKNASFPVVMSFHPNYNTYSESMILCFGDLNDNFLIVFPDGDLNTYFSDSPIDPRIREETFIIQELRPYLIENYRADSGRKWATMGISAGGYGSLAISMKHRDKNCVATSFGGPLVLYDVPSLHDKYMESRFGSKREMKENYIPFNLTWIAENTTLKDKELNIYFAVYENDVVQKNSENSVAFHQYLTSKNITHQFDKLNGSHHIENWEAYTLEKFIPFLLEAFHNNCEQ